MLELFRSSPGLALSAIAALAMGIGFTTTMFSIVHGATRSLPVAEPEEIVAVNKTAPEAAVDTSTRPFDYRAWSEAARSFEALAAFENVSINLAEDTREPERLSGAAVTANAFGLLGATPALGRAIEPGDTLALSIDASCAFVSSSRGRVPCASVPSADR